MITYESSKEAVSNQQLAISNIGPVIPTAREESHDGEVSPLYSLK